jgi:hypothetical protein
VREVILVGHLQGKHETGQRGAEDGSHPSSSATDQHQAPVLGFRVRNVPAWSATTNQWRSRLDAQTFQCSAATVSNGRDGGKLLPPEGFHVDIGGMFLAGGEDLFGRMLVGLAGVKLHDEPGRKKSEQKPQDHSPVMAKVE